MAWDVTIHLMAQKVSAAQLPTTLSRVCLALVLTGSVFQQVTYLAHLWMSTVTSWTPSPHVSHACMLLFACNNVAIDRL